MSVTRQIEVMSMHVEVLEARLGEALALLRESRGTLRTDQHDGHRRLAAKIDWLLREVDRLLPSLRKSGGSQP